jgi:hypothetical protein
MSELACGWKTIRKEALKKVHARIREKEIELGRELSEAEYRQMLKTVLKEEFARAFETCKTG